MFKICTLNHSCGDRSGFDQGQMQVTPTGVDLGSGIPHLTNVPAAHTVTPILSYLCFGGVFHGTFICRNGVGRRCRPPGFQPLHVKLHVAFDALDLRRQYPIPRHEYCCRGLCSGRADHSVQSAVGHDPKLLDYSVGVRHHFAASYTRIIPTRSPSPFQLSQRRAHSIGPLCIGRVCSEEPVARIGYPREKLDAAHHVIPGVVRDNGTQTVRLQLKIL